MARSLEASEGKFNQMAPFQGWTLSNNNANIKRVRKRISELEKRNEATLPEGWSFEGGRVVMNIEENRVQIIFDGKPNEAMRTELKSRGFRWAPSREHGNVNLPQMQFMQRRTLLPYR
ncbi:hypothetical protein N752_29845 [Desulforamulus aquiferis]|nr:hypothetical protein [Desulforamulus aquiferis]RYD01506.1 hypothetical protein N752_29845 [Desulforamulus aquiferis]